jgi:hypothetical protein
MAQINYTDIHKLLQEIHENRNSGLYGAYYTTLGNGFNSGLWSVGLTNKGIIELNKRGWSDYGVNPGIYAPILAVSAGSYLLTEASVELSTEDGTLIGT